MRTSPPALARSFRCLLVASSYTLPLAAQGGGTDWDAAQELELSSPQVGDAYGRAVALSEDVLAVGVPGDDELLQDAGSVRVYAWSQSGWVAGAPLFEPQPGVEQRFGSSLSLDADWLLVGAPLHGPDDSGAAYLFVRSGTDWVEHSTLTAPDGAPGDQLGWSAAVQGDTAIVGAPHTGVAGVARAGAAYVFGRDGSSWSFEAKLTPPAPAEGAAFGFSVAVWGDTIVVGNPFTQDNGGEAHVYERVGGEWRHGAVLLAREPGLARELNYGYSVDAFGDWIAVGSPGDLEPDLAVRVGSVSVYYNDGLGRTLKDTLYPPGREPGGRFGASVSIHHSRLVAGQPGPDETDVGGAVGTSGRVHVFSKFRDDWSEVVTLSSPLAEEHDAFGSAVALHQDRLVGGSPGRAGHGTAFPFERRKQTLHVDDEATAGGDGSAAAPFQAIGQALALAHHGDEVIVADGVYTGAPNRNLSFFGRDILLRSENGPGSCIIDCENAGRGFEIFNVESPAALIRGFTVRNANSAGGSMGLVRKRGGGFFVWASDPRIENCVVSECRATDVGGGMFFSDSRSHVRHCLVFLNRTLSDKGGGAGIGTANYPEATSPMFRDCVVRDNVSAGHGGGFYFSSQNPNHSDRLTQSIVYRNWAALSGGGVYTKGNVLVANCLIGANVAQHGGGFAGFGTLAVSDCTIVRNTASSAGGGIARCCDSEARVRNSILWNNSAPTATQISLSDAGTTVWCEYSDVMGGEAGIPVPKGAALFWGPGAIDADPMFRDPNGPDGNPYTILDNDYRLLAGSPAVDAGDNSAVPEDYLDLDVDGILHEPVPFDLHGRPRFVDDPDAPDTGAGAAPIVDMGACERVP